MNLNDPKTVHEFDQISSAPVVWRISVTEAGHAFEMGEGFAHPLPGKEQLHTIGLLQSIAHVANDIMQQISFDALKQSITEDDDIDLPPAVRDALFPKGSDDAH
ncbi:hypothetical protein [Rhodococcus opacus]|uniref:Uncharacterized protein n=1 Tax=Rhodococcus opacus (strain B4) TaxID=632772 RepID=C1B9A3_RHOOB|nr:hypothetical protein [Rhodococcus opacus]BAH52256.1 hypothetical protein ROP_40090 [Rhodococcus opacus B4]